MPGQHLDDPAPPLADFFLKLILWRLKNSHTAVRPPAIPCLCMAQTTSSNVKSGCFSISVSSQGACASKVDVLPPRGLSCVTPGLLKALHPFHCRTWTDVEQLGCLTTRSPAFHACNHSHANICRVCLRHGPPPDESNVRQTRSFTALWESCVLFDQNML